MVAIKNLQVTTEQKDRMQYLGTKKKNCRYNTLKNVRLCIILKTFLKNEDQIMRYYILIE